MIYTCIVAISWPWVSEHHLDTQTLEKHTSGHPNTFCQKFLKIFLSFTSFESATGLDIGACPIAPGK